MADDAIENEKRHVRLPKRDALDAVNNALKQLRLALQFEKY